MNIITNIGGSVQMSTGNSESDAALLLEKLRSLVDVLPHEIRAEAQSYISEIEQAAANPRQRIGLARRAYRALIGLTSGVIQNATWDSIKILFERVFPSV